jgi:hypothetical protein
MELLTHDGDRRGRLGGVRQWRPAAGSSNGSVPAGGLRREKAADVRLDVMNLVEVPAPSGKAHGR